MKDRTMQTNKTTYYQLILDQSGSMNNCKNETIEGFNKQMSSIRAMQEEYPEQEILVSLTKFSSRPEHLFLDQKVKEIENITTKTYRPEGNTALLDAIGECLLRLKAEKHKEFAEDKATAVVVIITDGFENASKFFSHAAIARLIDELSATDYFTFSFLGATIESVKEASRINISPQNTIRFHKESIDATFNNLAESISFYSVEKRKGRKPKNLFNENVQL